MKNYFHIILKVQSTKVRNILKNFQMPGNTVEVKTYNMGRIQKTVQSSAVRVLSMQDWQIISIKSMASTLRNALNG